MQQEIRIDIGCGDTLEAGWTAWDIKDGKDAADLSELADESVAEIRASHVLEHLPMAQTGPTLLEWHRVLRPGGRLFVAVPNFARIVGEIINGRDDPNLARYIMGGQTDEHDFHYALFTAALLNSYLLETGFKSVREVKAEGANTSRHWCSLNMEAYK
jgi:hypothetical protein